MPEEERKETAEGEDEPAAEEKAEAKAEEQPATEAKAEAKAEEQPATEAKAKAERPAKKAEAKAAEKQPPPPGSIADLFAEALPDVQLEAYQGMTDVIIEVNRDDIPRVMQTAKEDPSLHLNFLCSVFGVDYMEEGLEVVYQLFSYEKKHGVTVKTRLPADDPRVASVTSVWQGANWHERETRDMFGIEFEGHPHLVPLLLPEFMTDHFPLRKDNPLAEIEEWQAELAGEAAEGEEEAEE